MCLGGECTTLDSLLKSLHRQQCSRMVRWLWNQYSVQKPRIIELESVAFIPRYILRRNSIRTTNLTCLRRSAEPDFVFSDPLIFLYRLCTESVQILYRNRLSSSLKVLRSSPTTFCEGITSILQIGHVCGGRHNRILYFLILCFFCTESVQTLYRICTEIENRRSPP